MKTHDSRGMRENTALRLDSQHDSLVGGGALTVADYLARLTDSHVLDANALEDATQLLGAADATEDAEPWGRELVYRKILTRFQAASLLQQVPPRLVLHNYVLQERLSTGRMGDVYRAEHRRLKRTVAIKVLSPALIKSPEDVDRFRREVEAAGKLNHPNIVTAYDADEANGAHFLVMQYVAGVDLEFLVRLLGPLEISDAFHCILQAARGLAHAHACGVVHRDIKPGNMMLGTDGVLRILDMGLACMAPVAGADPDRESTGVSIPMGTAGFHAPEQARLNATPDLRSDLCSLGYTLHYLLTGRTAYEEEAPVKGHPVQVVRPEPSIRRHRPEVSEALEFVFQRMTALEPDHRHQTTEQFIGDLDACRIPYDKDAEQLKQSVIQILEAQEISKVPSGAEPLTDIDLTWSFLKGLHPTVPLPTVPLPCRA